MAVLFSALLGLGVGIMGYFGHYFSRGHFVHSTEAVLQTDMLWFAEIDDIKKLKQVVDNHSTYERRVYLLLDADGRKLAGDLDEMPKKADIMAEGTITFCTKDGTLVAARIHSYENGNRLLTGLDITQEARDFDRMQTLSIVTIVCMILVIIVSFVISTFVVSRTNRIARTAQTIANTGDMARRIEVDSKWDDLSFLAEVLNDFLARNEKLLKGMKQVSDNVAHDLRTPLTRLRNNLEALRKDANDDNTAAQCEDLLAEADRLLDTFAALMRIAHVESGKQRSQFKAVDMQSLVRDVADLYEPVAEEKNIVLGVTATQSTIAGDRDLLFQAVANLVDNAIKFTPEGGRISIAAGMENNRPYVKVGDTGSGVADADKPHIFERFYRANTSRNAAGNGLGLSLVGAVMDLHRGKIVLEDAHPGLVVTLQFQA